MRAVTLMRGLTFVGALSIMIAGAAAAQRSALREVREWGLVGGSAAVAIPVGEFAKHVGAGGGFDAFASFNLDRAGFTALRVDASILVYDRAIEVGYQPYYYDPAVLTTTSFIVSLRAGPQITLGAGPLRLYGFGQGGFSYFGTTSSFTEYGCGCASIDDDITEQEDLTWAWEAGGGLLVRVGRSGRLMLDLGARYLRNGQARYLPARMVSDGSALPLETEANLVALHIGVTVGLR